MSTKYRPEVSRKNEYWISKHRYYEISHMCFQYKEWKDEYKALSERGVSAVKYDGMPHGTNISDPTFEQAARMEALLSKMKLVEETAIEADPVLARYILTAVTDENVTYNYLQQVMKMPCGKNMYYRSRRKFYWLMSRKL